MAKRLLVAALALGTGISLLSGCVGNSTKPAKDAARSSKAPAWVTQPPQMRGMAYGIGSMEIYGSATDAVKRAAELARIDLVSQLKVTVSGDFSSETVELSGTNRDSEVLRTVRNYVRSQVPPAELDEVQISETHTDAKYAYALAELDRNAAAARLRRDMNDIEQELSAIGELQPSGNRLQQLQPLLPALTLFAKRKRLGERLTLISMERKAPALSPELKALQDRIYAQIDQLQVSLELLDDGAQTIGGGVLEALTSQGLRIQDGSDADLRFDISAQLSGKAKDGSHYVFADSRVTIRDGAGRVLSSFSKQAKGVSGLEDVARQKAAREVAKLIGDELAVALVDKIR